MVRWISNMDSTEAKGSNWVVVLFFVKVVVSAQVHSSFRHGTVCVADKKFQSRPTFSWVVSLFAGMMQRKCPTQVSRQATMTAKTPDASEAFGFLFFFVCVADRDLAIFPSNDINQIISGIVELMAGTKKSIKKKRLHCFTSQKTPAIPTSEVQRFRRTGESFARPGIKGVKGVQVHQVYSMDFTVWF